MTAAKRDLYIEQGATFSRGFFWHRPKKDTQGNIIRDPSGNPVPGDPYDLTDWKGRMQIRESVEATTALVTATTENGEIVFGLDPENPGAEADPTNGRVDILLSADTTDLLTVTYGVYDLKVYDPGAIEHRLLEGSVSVSPAVTRDDSP
jgi:hypothetical protein